jgi:lipoprotein-anchoring transpeptidase ErfK/SrfK
LWWDDQDPKNHWKTNWTLGCIALNNQEIEEIFNYTEVNTPILILP